jgi:hypothetical protein
VEGVGTIARIVLRQRDVLLALLAGVAVLAPLGIAYAQHRRWSTGRVACAALAGAGLALVPATTLARGPVRLGWGRTCNLDVGLPDAGPEALLNTVLFVPAVFFGVLALRRAVVAVLAAGLCSVAVEAAQLVGGLGVCQSADVMRNTVGAGAAALTALIVLAVPAAREGAAAQQRRRIRMRPGRSRATS